MAQFDWVSEGRVDVDGVTFFLPDFLPENAPSTPDPSAPDPALAGLRLLKTRPLIEIIAGIVDELAPKRIFELGIHRGGSVALLMLLARPERHVAIELAPEAPALDAWLAEHDTDGVVRTYYGVDQGDAARLTGIVEDDFAGEPLDFVIDDASHEYGPTLASFNTLFPYLRAGGLYVIEDWSWLHLVESAILADPEELARAKAAPPRDAAATRALAAPSPARLLMQQLLACAGPFDVVGRLVVDRYVAIVKRGEAPLDPATFDIAECFGDLGRSLFASFD